MLTGAGQGCLKHSRCVKTTCQQTKTETWYQYAIGIGQFIIDLLLHPQ